MYIFRDHIGAWGSYNPTPVFTPSNPPFTHNTLLKYAPQTYRVGMDTVGSGGGTQVYSGTIEYYQDHGRTQ